MTATDRHYGSPRAFRRALTDKLRDLAEDSRWSLPQLQRQIAYDRLLERLYLMADEWIVKGAAALLARDLAVRETVDVDVHRAATLQQAPHPGRVAPASRCSRSGSGIRRPSVEPEDCEQSGVDPPLFFRCEMAGEVAESLEIDGSDLLDEHASRGAVDVDLGSEGRWFGAGRCGCHQYDRSWEKRV